MPLTPKGKKILTAMKKQYGAKKGKEVFYASINKGKLKGVHGKKKGKHHKIMPIKTGQLPKSWGFGGKVKIKVK